MFFGKILHVSKNYKKQNVQGEQGEDGREEVHSPWFIVHRKKAQRKKARWLVVVNMFYVFA